MKKLLFVATLCLYLPALAHALPTILYTTGVGSTSNSDPIQAQNDALHQAQIWANLACAGIVVNRAVIGLNYTTTGSSDDGTLTYLYTAVVRDLCEIQRR